MIIDEILCNAREAQRTLLTEIESKQILSEAGIICIQPHLAVDKARAVSLSEEMGYPVVLKISSVDISHKSDAGGVRVNLKDPEAVEVAFDEILTGCQAAYPNATIEGITVQSMAKTGTEVIMGVIKDATFGPVVMFGLGGVLVEVLKDVAFRIVPIETSDAVAMMSEIQGRKLLEGYRNRKPADQEFLQAMLVKLSDFVQARPEIEAIDMNPVFAYPTGAVVADARIILSR